MSKKVVVKTVGQTDTYTNAVTTLHESGALTVGKEKQPYTKVTYAVGRWITVTEEGIHG